MACEEAAGDSNAPLPEPPPPPREANAPPPAARKQVSLADRHTLAKASMKALGRRGRQEQAIVVVARQAVLI